MSIVSVKDFGDALNISGGTIRSKISRKQLLRNKKGFIDTENPTNYIYLLEVNGGDQSVFEEYHQGVISKSKIIKKSVDANKSLQNIASTSKKVVSVGNSVSISEKSKIDKLNKIKGSVNIAPSQNKTRKCKECGDDFVNTVSHRSLTYCGIECQKKVKSKVNLNNKQLRKNRIDSGDIDFIANEIYGKYKQRSPSRGLEFDLTLDFFKKHVHADCYYCGNSIPKVGFDRVDNSVGYIEDNCVPCCPDCNFMKRDLSFDDFIEQCQLIANNFKIEDVDINVKKTKNLDLEKLSVEEKREKEVERKARRSFLDMEVRKKQADLSVVERNAEIKQMQLEKIAGNTLPLDITKTLLKVNLQSIMKTFKAELENIATISVEILGGTREDLVRITNEQDLILSKLIKIAKSNADLEIERIVNEYSEVRSRGERK